MNRLLSLFDRLLQRVMPDPFVIAILLTAATFFWCTLFRPPGASVDHWTRAGEVIGYWGDGFWNLAQFTLQMAMVLIGGYVVAISRPVTRLLRFLIGFVRSPVQAVLFCTLTAIAASLINWGLGLVVGAIVAIEVGRQVPRVPFRLLVASSYSGFIVWHGGLSGSIPLVLNSPGNVSSALTGELIPLSDTMFSPLNVIAVLSMAVLLPLVNLLYLRMHLRTGEGDSQSIQPRSISSKSSQSAGKGLATDGDGDRRDDRNVDPTIWINRSRLSIGILVTMAVLYWCKMIAGGDFSLNLNSVIFIFFMSGLLLHGTPTAFIDAFTEATPKIAPILIQYPLYAGIMAMLVGSSLADGLSEWFVQRSTPRTFTLMTFYSAGMLNLLVPSGGGQWVIQVPIVVSAAEQLGVDLPRVAMAVAWGDAWTNLAQPFWAIPVLTIAGLGIRDIISFCLLTLIASGTVLSLIFLLL